MSKVKTWIRHILVFLAAVAVLAGLYLLAQLYASESQKKIAEAQEESLADADEKNGGTLVKVIDIFHIPLTDALTLPGSVRAVEDIDLSPKAGGTVEWIGVDEGDEVEKGDKLLQLDVDLLKVQEKKAQTTLDLARRKFERARDLYDKNVTSQNAFDEAETALEEARQALEAIRVQIEYASLVSPVSGHVDARDVDVGEYIDAGRPVMKIVDIDQVEVHVDVPEKDVLYFEKGENVDIKADGGGERREFTGTVAFMALQANPISRTYLMKIIVENPDHFLRPGMIVRAKLIRRRIKDGIAVPFFSMMDRKDGKAVYVVENGLAKEVPVEYGIIQGGMVEITEGLEVGDKLVIVGQRDLTPAQELSIESDLTGQAKAFVQSGGDLAQLVLEISEKGVEEFQEMTLEEIPEEQK